VLAQEFNSSTFTRHNERDISRLQSTINEYSTLLTYNVDDQVSFSGTNYKNITAITVGETFVPAKWDSLDGALNTIYVNDSSQFPDAATGFFTHVQSSGEDNDARFFFRESLVYLDGQVANITNSTVSAYDGLRTIKKREEYLYDRHSFVTSTGDSRAIDVDSTTNRYFSVDGNTDELHVTDGNTNQVIATIAVQGNPESVVVFPEIGRAYVANFDGVANVGSVSVIDIEIGSGTIYQVIATVVIGLNTGPIDLAVNKETNRLYTVLNTIAAVRVIDVEPGSVNENLGIATINFVGTDPIAIASNDDKNLLYVVDATENNARIINGRDNSINPTTITLGTAPSDVDLNPDTGFVYFTNSADDTVSVYNEDTGIVELTIGSGGTLSLTLVVDRTKNQIYVAHQTTDDIGVIDGRTHVLIDVIDSDGTLTHSVGVNETTGTVIAGNETSTNLSIISVSPTNTSKVIVPSGSAPVAVNINNNTKKGYTASLGNTADVTVFDSITGEILKTIAGIDGASDITINEKKNEIYVVSESTDSMVVIDGSDDTILSTITAGIGTSPLSSAFDPINDVICVVNSDDNTASFLSSVTFLALSGSPVTVETNPSNVAVNTTTGKFFVTNRDSASMTKIDSATRAVDILSITVGTTPTDVAVNNVTDTVYTSNAGSDDVTKINGLTGAFISTISIPGTNPNPFGISVNPITSLVYVASLSVDTISIIDSTDTVINTIDTSADLTNGQGPQGITINPVTDFLYVTYRNSDNATILPPLTFDVTGLTFTTTASGDTTRELSGTDAYILQIPISTAFGYQLTSPTGTFSLTSASIFENRITMTGNSTTFLTIDNLTAAEVVNCEVDDGTGNNTLLNITGSGLASFMFFTNFGAFGFDTLGTVTDAFLPLLANSFIFFNNGLVITNAKVNINSMAINSIVPGADYLTINNITDLGIDPFFTQLSSTVPSGSTLFNINAATPVENTIVISNSGPGGTGDYFKAGTELTKVITAFADAGGGDVTVTSTAHGLVAGQSLEITNSINYNAIFAIVGTPGANDFVITRTFIAETPASNTIFTQVKAINSYAANTATVGTVDSTADNGSGGTTVTDTAHGIVRGTSVTISATTSYNGTFTIFNVTTNTFDIAVAFVGDESGTWLANKTLIDVTAHGFSNGTPILVDKTIDYDQGYFAESVTTDTLVINKLFVTDESTGTVTDASLNQKTLNVLLNTVTGQINSKAKGSYSLSGNAATTTLAADTFTDLNLNSLATETSDTELFRLIDSTTGELEYRGLEPFSGELNATISATKVGGGGNVSYLFRAVINGGQMIDNIVEPFSAGTDIENLTVTFPVTAVTGDQFKLQVSQVGGDDIIIDSVTLVIQ